MSHTNDWELHRSEMSIRCRSGARWVSSDRGNSKTTARLTRPNRTRRSTDSSSWREVLRQGTHSSWRCSQVQHWSAKCKVQSAKRRGTRTLNFEFWTLNFRIHRILKHPLLHHLPHNHPLSLPCETIPDSHGLYDAKRGCWQNPQKGWKKLSAFTHVRTSMQQDTQSNWCITGKFFSSTKGELNCIALWSEESGMRNEESETYRTG